MKIWVIGRAVPSKQNNMNGSFEYEQAQMLAKRGVEVFYPVVDLRFIHRWRKFGLVRTTQGNMSTVVLNVPIGRLLPPQPRGRVGAWLRKKLYLRMVKEYGLPDVIHIHYPALWDYDAFEELQRKGVKIVETEHWTKVQENTLPDFNREYLKEHVKKCDVFTCVGEPLKHAIKKMTGTDRQIHVIPNVVPDMFVYDPASADAHSVFRFVAAGRLAECKRFDLLIDAFADTFGGRTDVVLDIIGGGDQRGLLERKIDEYNCAGQVRLLGVMNRAEIAEHYKTCNALVLSSNLETFGVPVIEAFACGMPVVTTDAIGFVSYINDGNGIVVNANDQEQLAAAMERLYSNYANYDRLQIAEAARENFSEDAVANRIISIYKELL